MNNFMSFVFGWVCCIALLVLLFHTIPEYTSMYRQGQIDAINGKVYFELKQQADNTTTWERKK